MAKERKPPPGGKRLIFRPYYRNPKTGKLVYPRSGRVFPMWVDY